jgi:hypothetical protein
MIFQRSSHFNELNHKRPFSISEYELEAAGDFIAAKRRHLVRREARSGNQPGEFINHGAAIASFSILP